MNFYEYIISLIALKTKKKFQYDENFTCLKFFFCIERKIREKQMKTLFYRSLFS